jgi:hypothetical protein
MTQNRTALLFSATRLPLWGARPESFTAEAPRPQRGAESLNQLSAPPLCRRRLCNERGLETSIKLRDTVSHLREPPLRRLPVVGDCQNRDAYPPL